MYDTIAAIATGNGLSAIGIVRISGPIAIEAADRVFRMSGGGRLNDAESKKMHYGELWSSERLIDMCLCVISRASSSYTGEDTVEFHCHGSPIVLSDILQTLFLLGVRQALPGEFTKRAFLNGRIDLTQAEAVIDLIESETVLAAQNAAGQIRGTISRRLEVVYSTLIDIVAHFYAIVDYPDEDIDEFELQNYRSDLESSKVELTILISSFKRGRVLRNGVKTAIIGRPNTGKSSLLNALLGFDRAIVAEIPGTTRDTIEEKVLIGNILLRLTDTAGLRETTETVEMLGVERTIAAIENAELILFVIDGFKEMHNNELDILLRVPSEAPVIFVINKCDLALAFSDDDLNKIIKALINKNQNKIIKSYSIARISALSGEGLSDLEDAIKDLFPEPPHDAIGEIITNTRQYESIVKAYDSITEAITAMLSTTPDAILTEIEAALNAIGEVTGKTIREDIILRIFERFCVGK